MHPDELFRRMSQEELNEATFSMPSNEISYALVEALLREDPRSKQFIEQLIATRSALMLHLRNQRDYQPAQIGTVLGWCLAQSNRFCWDGIEDNPTTDD